MLADAAPLNYFGHSKAAESVSHYDCRFNSPEGWDQRRARCDRRPTSRVHSKIYDEASAARRVKAFLHSAHTKNGAHPLIFRDRCAIYDMRNVGTLLLRARSEHWDLITVSQCDR